MHRKCIYISTTHKLRRCVNDVKINTLPHLLKIAFIILTLCQSKNIHKRHNHDKIENSFVQEKFTFLHNFSKIDSMCIST